MTKKKKRRKKQQRKSEKRRIRNLKVKNKIKDLSKEFRSLISANQIEKAKNLLSLLYKALDKAAKEGIIKKGTRDRKKSKLAKLLSEREEKGK